MNFRTFFVNFCIKAFWDFIEIALNLKINRSQIYIFWLQTWISFHLLRSYLISLSNILQFFKYGFFTYFIKVIPMMFWFLAQSSKMPSNFLNDKSVKVPWYLWQIPFNYTWVYINEVTFEKHLKMGADFQENQPYDWRIVTFNPTPHTSEGGTDSWINGQWPKI